MSGKSSVARFKAHGPPTKQVGDTLSREWHQKTPDGDFALVYFEMDEIKRLFEAIRTSNSDARRI
ncbi:MAG: hypothetical protein QGH20_03615 [Candidatus Latescibacteria bacterium]|jgi:hypothetical protein|nr:hypothetical protein [Candidatus Latescibacterota bacterium]